MSAPSTATRRTWSRPCSATPGRSRAAKTSSSDARTSARSGAAALPAAHSAPAKTSSGGAASAFLEPAKADSGACAATPSSTRSSTCDAKMRPSTRLCGRFLLCVASKKAAQPAFSARNSSGAASSNGRTSLRRVSRCTSGFFSASKSLATATPSADGCSPRKNSNFLSPSSSCGSAAFSTLAAWPLALRRPAGGMPRRRETAGTRRAAAAGKSGLEKRTGCRTMRAYSEAIVSGVDTRRKRL